MHLEALPGTEKDAMRHLGPWERWGPLPAHSRLSPPPPIPRKMWLRPVQTLETPTTTRPMPLRLSSRPSLRTQFL